jgi:alkanesulfonate monooxygenase SsuD/methylene tetrahydromethanopterin reductase-like flavin-dependent oxidoreductase (luciferase family)
MRIAIGLPSRAASASGALMLEWITRAERSPFSSAVVTDRVVFQALEPLSVLAMAAGATQRIRLRSNRFCAPLSNSVAGVSYVPGSGYRSQFNK